MFQRMKGNESGQSIVIIAFAMVAIIGMAALVLDGGYAYLERRRVQNAADAAVLAGVRTLAALTVIEKDKPESGPAIRLAIDRYAERNGITSPSTNIKAYFVNADSQIIDAANQVGSGAVPDDARGIVLRAGEQHDTFFAQVIGFPKMQVSALAQASYVAAASIPDLVPLAVQTDSVKYNTDTVLWDKDNYSGVRDWLNFDTQSRSNEELMRWMCSGYDFHYELPVWIGGTPGVRTSSLDSCTLPGRVVFVPIYSEKKNSSQVPGCLFPGGSSQPCFKIIGFGAFELTCANQPDCKQMIKGRFIRWVMIGELGGESDMGAVGYRLTPAVTVP
jgi:hypothetical protein